MDIQEINKCVANLPPNGKLVLTFSDKIPADLIATLNKNGYYDNGTQPNSSSVHQYKGEQIRLHILPDKSVLYSRYSVHS